MCHVSALTNQTSSSTPSAGHASVPHEETIPFSSGEAASSPYALTKHMGEALCALYDAFYGLPTTSLRLFMVYGPRQPTDGEYATVTGKFLAMKRRGEPLRVEGAFRFRPHTVPRHRIL
jgi:nucleoside-diphosphate-sugar epimerase